MVMTMAENNDVKNANLMELAGYKNSQNRSASEAGVQ